MVKALDAKTDVEQNFKAAMGNALRIGLLENKFSLNEKLREVATQTAAVNELLTSLNTVIADANEELADLGSDMVSENAEWVDGALAKMFKAARPESNSDIVKNNAGRLESLTDKVQVIEQDASLAVTQIETETKSILDTGDDIAARRARIQAEREKVIANQKRSSELMSK